MCTASLSHFPCAIKMNISIFGFVIIFSSVLMLIEAEKNSELQENLEIKNELLHYVQEIKNHSSNSLIPPLNSFMGLIVTGLRHVLSEYHLNQAALPNYTQMFTMPGSNTGVLKATNGKLKHLTKIGLPNKRFAKADKLSTKIIFPAEWDELTVTYDYTVKIGKFSSSGEITSHLSGVFASILANLRMDHINLNIGVSSVEYDRNGTIHTHVEDKFENPNVITERVQLKVGRLMSKNVIKTVPKTVLNLLKKPINIVNEVLAKLLQ